MSFESFLFAFEYTWLFFSGMIQFLINFGIKRFKTIRPGNGNVIFISGACSGIGLTMAKHFAKLGYTVYAGVLFENDMERMSKVDKNIIPVRLNVTNNASVTSAFNFVTKQIEENGYQLVALFNNAGIGAFMPVEFTSMETLQNYMNVNFYGIHRLTTAFLPLIRKHKGRIINTTSGFGRMTSPLFAAYCASKYAAEAYSDALRLELASQGISVSALEPGFTNTALIHEKFFALIREKFNQMNKETRERYEGLVRVVETYVEWSLAWCAGPQNVALAAQWALESDYPKARYVTGLDSRLFLFLNSVLPERWMDGLYAMMESILPRKQVE